MNQLCKVCGEPAAGFHFGAFTCEGCKSFFGRTYNNISAIAGCKNNGDCVINKKNRTACKACRLRKCLLVGMSKSGSRYGRRSNWFKIHCLLQEQQTQHQTDTGDGTPSSGGSGANASFEQLARLHQIQARQTYQDKTNPCIKTTNMSPTLHLPALSHNVATPHRTPPGQHEFLAAAKFFNGIDGHHHASVSTKSESRLSDDTPSDSGASSADDPADDCASTASGRHHHKVHTHTFNSTHQTDCRSDDVALADERDRRRQQLLQIFRSHSEPLRSAFAPFAITNLPPPIMARSPPAHILPALHEEIKRAAVAAAAVAAAAEETSSAAPKTIDTQDEPIDLSVKRVRVNQQQQHSSTCTHTPHSSSSTLSSPAAFELSEVVNVIRKPIPLDLTLVRSQTLTG